MIWADWAHSQKNSSFSFESRIFRKKIKNLFSQKVFKSVSTTFRKNRFLNFLRKTYRMLKKPSKIMIFAPPVAFRVEISIFGPPWLHRQWTACHEKMFGTPARHSQATLKVWGDSAEPFSRYPRKTAFRAHGPTPPRYA